MKKLYEWDEVLYILENAEETGVPYKLIKATEPQFNEITEQTTVVDVWLFKFL